ncbi:MAG: prepilin-type N-terminal cleavage/methylation domain-containing protein, partial [Candidatus Omnitrophica bacterium]|nr:prepilin-type N-terminal cleavage/methylation domain-containing protein [Candidatus Omnitrophota bacterium]
MGHGFTLLELIIVIIIIGILAVLGLTQYNLVTETGRAAEARAILGAARKAELSYYLNKGAYTTSFADLDIAAPTSCTNTHYFKYDLSMEAGSERVRAQRCS